MTIKTSSTHTDQKTQVDKLFARGLLEYEMHDFQQAKQRMTEILAHDDHQDLAIVRSKAAGVLGLIELRKGRLEEASTWMNQARIQQTIQFESPWTRFLNSAISAIRARLATENVVQQMEEAKLELENEIRLLEDEITVFSEGVYLSIKGITPEIEAAGRTTELSIERMISLPRVINAKLFGPFEARLNAGSEIHLCSNKKGQSIFMILVTRPGTLLHKEILQELLWPHENPVVTIGKLHTAISRLRMALRESAFGDDFILFENDYYFINPELDVDSDVDRFEQHVSKGIHLDSMQQQEAAMVELEKAKSLYTSEYLEEIRAEDWPIFERTRQESRYLEVLSNLAILYFDKADLSSCIKSVEELLQYDNLREDACRLLMESHFIRGNRIQAIRAYQDLEAALERELGVEPDRKTRQLFENIRNPQV